MLNHNLLREISITEFKNINIGHAQDYDGGTGCTVIICKEPAAAGVDVRGGGPASRETQTINPMMSIETINAVVLAGGSAFGLDAAGGVMKYLEEKGVGFDVGVTKVPIVCQSDLFDLTVGSCNVRPDFDMGYAACINSEKNNPLQGCIGAGTGATVGKILGMQRCTKSGIGMYAVQLGELMVGAVVAVNSLGDVFEHESGRKIAGVLDDTCCTLDEKTCEEYMYELYNGSKNQFAFNTTIGVVITNAKFSKTHMTKIAQMAQNGYARSISPVHTMLDGDTVYALSVGEIDADINLAGTLSAYAASKAIENAVNYSKSMFGFKAVCDLKKK